MIYHQMNQTPKLWKICGMRDAKNILEVAVPGPDLMGFIFYERSPRYVGIDFQVPGTFPKSIKKVGVFVNATLDEVLEKAESHHLEFVQLHGDETPAFCKEVRSHGIGVIKVFSVGPGFDFSVTGMFEGAADLFLFDTKGASRGGNGVPFDWSVLKEYSGKTNFLLSGGLSVANIEEALSLEMEMLVGFDLNSGVETSPGIKDIVSIEKIKKALTTKARVL